MCTVASRNDVPMFSVYASFECDLRASRLGDPGFIRLLAMLKAFIAVVLDQDVIVLICPHFLKLPSGVLSFPFKDEISFHSSC